MIVGTTPTHTFNIPFDVSNIAMVRVIYAQNNNVVLTKTNEDCVLEDNTVSVTLTQEDTFLFDHTLPVEIQLRILTVNGTSLGSIPKKVGVTKCLEDVVME